MDLDFTPLLNIGLNDVENTFEKKDTPNKEKGLKIENKAKIEQEENQLANIKLNKMQEEYNRMLEVYKEHQHNIKECGQIRTEIIKGVKVGEAPEVLFLKACKCISLLTGDRLFYNQIEKDLKKRYGENFSEPILEWEL